MTVKRETHERMINALWRLRQLEKGDRVDHSAHEGCKIEKSWKTAIARDIAAILNEAEVNE
jgi:predicted component of type VI protein secretion system